jgi:hypothetical protein
MLGIIQIEEIASLLLGVPALVRQQESRSFAFAESVSAWLESLETVLAANHLHHAGQVATARSGLISTRRGLVPQNLNFRGLPSRTRVLSAVASQALQTGSEIASAIITENRPRILDAERVAQQIVAVALARGIIPARPPGGGNTEFLRSLRRVLVSEELEAGTVHLEGLVGPHDALILLDRALTLFSGARSTPHVANSTSHYLTS